MSGAEGEALALTVSDVRQQAYCPRIPYFRLGLRVTQPPVTYQMTEGILEHRRTEALEQRRSLRAYGLGDGERRFDLALRSERLGLSGRLDLLIVREGEAIPVEFKNSAAGLALQHKYQLAAYALLVEELTGRSVRRAFVYFIPKREAREVAITPAMRAYSRRLIGEIRRNVRMEQMPEGTRQAAVAGSASFSATATIAGSGQRLRIQDDGRCAEHRKGGAMYFPSELEERFVLRRLLPEARREGVVEELRGWTWHQAPVRPIYEAPLGVYEVAARYCQSGRDIYLRRVQGLRSVPNRGMLDGRALHGLVAGLVVDAKRLIYQHGRGCLEPLEGLREGGQAQAEAASPEEPTRPDLEQKLGVVRAFQTRRIVERVERVLAAQPNANADTLVTLALPASVELRLDGSYLGLSRYLAADAVLFAGGAVADLKFGPREPFHRLTTTGYALVLESLYERPVDLGCIVYAEVRDGRLLIERDFHIIGDELRQWFLQEREEKARLVAEELDPGLPGAVPAKLRVP